MGAHVLVPVSAQQAAMQASKTGQIRTNTARRQPSRWGSREHASAPADVSSPQLCNISSSPYLWEIGVNGVSISHLITSFPLIKANVCHHK
eukprot:scaffold3801_cov124-Isochrysis_galbana.AAC.19